MKKARVAIDQPGWKWDGEVEYMKTFHEPPACVIKAGVRVQDINTGEPFVIAAFQMSDRNLVVLDADDNHWAQVDEVRLA